MIWIFVYLVSGVLYKHHLIMALDKSRRLSSAEGVLVVATWPLFLWWVASNGIRRAMARRGLLS